MAFFKLGKRDDLEKGIKMLFFIPALMLCPLITAGLLKDQIPTFFGFVLGGAIGGVIAFLISQAIINIINSIWPKKDV